MQIGCSLPTSIYGTGCRYHCQQVPSVGWSASTAWSVLRNTRPLFWHGNYCPSKSESLHISFYFLSKPSSRQKRKTCLCNNSPTNCLVYIRSVMSQYYVTVTTALYMLPPLYSHQCTIHVTTTVFTLLHYICYHHCIHTSALYMLPPLYSHQCTSVHRVVVTYSALVLLLKIEQSCIYAVTLHYNISTL